MKIFSCQKDDSSDRIECFDGIRVISAFQIVVVHAAFAYHYLPVQNRIEADEVRLYEIIVGFF